MSKLAHSNDATMFEIEKTHLGIVTAHIYPPIPIRTMDWQACYEDDEPDDDGHMRVGHGATEQEAVTDLIESYPPDGPTDEPIGGAVP